jgi:hypothetical protein
MNPDDARIAEPCPPVVGPADFERTGPDSVYCKVCNKHVYDLSSMTDREASAFVQLNAHARPCIVYTLGADGLLVHASDVTSPGRLPAAVMLGASRPVACNTHSDPSRATPADVQPDSQAPAPAELPTDLPSVRGRMRPLRPANPSPECNVPYVIDENGIEKSKHE